MIFFEVDLGLGPYETFSVCVHMSRNVVVSFAEGSSDVLDDKKNVGLYDFFSRFGGYMRGGLYTRGYTRAFTVQQQVDKSS